MQEVINTAVKLVEYYFQIKGTHPKKLVAAKGITQISENPLFLTQKIVKMRISRFRKSFKFCPTDVASK